MTPPFLADIIDRSEKCEVNSMIYDVLQLEPKFERERLGNKEVNGIFF